MANQGDNCRYYIGIYIGGVNLKHTGINAEWLPRWGHSILHSAIARAFGFA